MCYIDAMSDRVGIRELRQDLSRYLRRVRDGERLIVTERRQPVAVIEPWVDESDALEQLIGQGLATRGTGGLTQIEPLQRRVSSSGTNALDDERAERLG
jgi:prevent-host-death family protein